MTTRLICGCSIVSSYNATLGNKSAPQPFLTMLIDLSCGQRDGVPSAAIVGDFLDKGIPGRALSRCCEYHIVAEEYRLVQKYWRLHTERLRSVQLGAGTFGKHRIIFRTRPYNNTPYFSLAKTCVVFFLDRHHYRIADARSVYHACAGKDCDYQTDWSFTCAVGDL